MTITTQLYNFIAMIVTDFEVISLGVLIKQLFYSRLLDMRWQIANGARSAVLAITISYPTIASGIIVLLKHPKKLLRNQLQYHCNKDAQI